MNEKGVRDDAQVAPGVWFLTADRRQARLLEGVITAHNRLHLDLRAQVKEQWNDLQHSRPSPRSGKGGHTYASQGHENEERTHRFAKQVATWLEAEIGKRLITRVHAFLAPRFLGQIRGVLPDQLHDSLIGHSLNLAHLKPGELALHGAVVAIEQLERTATKQPPMLERVKAVIAMTSDRDRANQIAHEHAEVRTTIGAIRGEMDRLRAEAGPEHGTGQLPAMLRDFELHLVSHFEIEESGASTQSQQGSKTFTFPEHLLQQHRDLELKLRLLIDAAESAQEGQACLSDAYVDGLSEFLSLLLQHEADENAIVQKHILESASAGG